MNETNKLDQMQDEELAAFTDALLAGRTLAEPPPLAQVVQSVAQAAAPHPVPDSLRQKIRRQVSAEWARRPPSFMQQLSRAFRRPARRWAWVAGGAAILIAAGAAWLAPPSQPFLTGTAAGNAGPVIAGVVIIVFIGAAIAAWLGARR